MYQVIKAYLATKVKHSIKKTFLSETDKEKALTIIRQQGLQSTRLEEWLQG
jgi:hypothetical protein